MGYHTNDGRGATLTVDKSNTVILRSTVIPNAGTYSFLYSNDPTTARTSGTSIGSSTPEARHDVLSDGMDYYYVVEDNRIAECPAP